MLKEAFCFVSGAIAGGFVMYQATKKVIQREADEEIAAIKEHYHKKANDIREKAVTKREEELKEDLKAMEDRLRRRDDISVKSQTSTVAETAREITKGMGYSMDEEMEEDEGPEEAPVSFPYVITPAKFLNEKTFYDKLTITYYKKDRVLATEDGEVLDIPACIGMAALSHFGEYEKDVVYVRNERLSIDYEVIRENLSYKAHCLGEGDE